MGIMQLYIGKAIGMVFFSFEFVCVCVRLMNKERQELAVGQLKHLATVK